MALNLGNGVISKLYLGATEVTKAYFGNVLVFNAITPNGLLNNLEAYYEFENDVTDSLGNFDAVDSGTSDIVGKIGRGRDFDGVNDSVASPYQFANTTSFTLNGWIKPDDVSTQQYYASSIGPQSSFRNGFIFGINGSNIRCKVYNGTQFGERGALTSNAHGMTIGGSYMMTLRYTESSKLLEYLINNVLIESTTLNSSIQHQTTTSIGKQNKDTINVPYNGMLDEMPFYNTNLSDEKLGLLYNSGAGLAFSNFTT